MAVAAALEVDEALVVGLAEVLCFSSDLLESLVLCWDSDCPLS